MRKFLTYFFTFVIGVAVAGAGLYFGPYKTLADEKEVLQGDNSTLRLKIQEQGAETQAQAPEPVADENVTVTTLVKANCAADAKNDTTKGVFTVKKLTAPFATVSYSCATDKATSLAILKKSGDGWAIVYQGEKAPDKATIDKYAIPKDFQS